MKNILLGTLIAILALGSVSGSVRAQEKISLTVTPPFIQLTIKPGDFWASSLKIVNTNPADLVVYPTVMDFSAEGEEGRGKFRPVLPDGSGQLLASWIDVPPDAITVPPEQSREIPFTVRIPEDAPPGGHYAAILVGTKPFGAQGEGAVVSVASFVSSLFFVRISGEAAEQGFIRDFTTDRRRYDGPAVDFHLRFENTGNVHLQPQGHVMIYNMWGKERGKIALNERTELGNVLPQSVRKFSLRWEGEQSLFDIGRYTAVATLAYGTGGKRNVTAALSFWIIPVRATLAVLGGIAGFLLLLVWSVRRYVRKAVELAVVRPGPAPAPARLLAAPLAQTVVDLRALRAEGESARPLRRRLRRKYMILFGIILPLFILGALWTAAYVRDSLRADRPFRAEMLGPREGSFEVEPRN